MVSICPCDTVTLWHCDTPAYICHTVFTANISICDSWNKFQLCPTFSRSLSTLCSTVQHSSVQYSTVQYSTVQYSTVQYSTVHVFTIPAHPVLSPWDSCSAQCHYILCSLMIALKCILKIIWIYIIIIRSMTPSHAATRKANAVVCVLAQFLILWLMHIGAIFHPWGPNLSHKSLWSSLMYWE